MELPTKQEAFEVLCELKTEYIANKQQIDSLAEQRASVLRTISNTEKLLVDPKVISNRETIKILTKLLFSIISIAINPVFGFFVLGLSAVSIFYNIKKIKTYKDCYKISKEYIDALQKKLKALDDYEKMLYKEHKSLSNKIDQFQDYVHSGKMMPIQEYLRTKEDALFVKYLRDLDESFKQEEVKE